MKRCSTLSVSLCLLAWAPAVLAQGTIKDFSLKDGVNDENEIAAPVFDASAMAPVSIGAIAREYDTKALMFRKGSKGSAWNGAGPEYRVDPRVDLGVFFKEALEKQGAAMGLRMAKSEDGAWALRGSIKDIHFSTEQTAGATLFYGTARVLLALRAPDGKTTNEELTLHSYKAVHRKGYSREGRAVEALAASLVEWAHESLAYLQMRTWRLPLHARTQTVVDTLESSRLNDIYRLGLTGNAAVGTRLLKLLPQRTKADERRFIIEALARLRVAESVQILGERYKGEDEDCRWATVKAMGYIDGDAARGVLKERGLADDYLGAKQLAQDILAAR